jgi:malate synthase
MIYILKDEIDHGLREARRAAIVAGRFPEFGLATSDIRETEWSAGAPDEACVGPQDCLAGVQSAGEADAWKGSRPPGGPPLVFWLDSVWAAFEVEEILYALRGLVCRVECDVDGYLYSVIETFQEFPEFVLPDRADIAPATHMLSSLTRLVADICQRRRVRTDDAASVGRGDQDRIEPADLLHVPRGRITERGMRQSIRIALDYLGDGAKRAAADADGLRARSAAMLAAAQLWQWVIHDTGVLAEGRIVTGELFSALLEQELERRATAAASAAAASVLRDTVLSKSFTMHAFSEQPGPGEGKR